MDANDLRRYDRAMKSGGPRKGAGRPRGPQRVAVTVRVTLETRAALELAGPSVTRAAEAAIEAWARDRPRDQAG